MYIISTEVSRRIKILIKILKNINIFPILDGD